MSSGASRDELTAAVMRSGRKVAAQATLFSQAVADRLGLAGSDIECLDILIEEGRLTVGRLAELTGLTTGSATRMVDRLEQAGYVSRSPDPADRRRVLVAPVPERLPGLSALHDSLRAAQREAVAAYDDDQLAAIASYLEASVDVLREEATRLREPAATEAQSGGSFAAPIGGVTAGRLVFLSGAPRITVRGDATLTELYRAEFAGPVPRMRVRGGVVTVTYPRFGWFDWRTQVAGQHIDASAHWRKDAGEIVLNSAIPWAIELRGGVSQWTADMRSLRLESFELRGGASKIELVLPAPSGVVPIRISGGMSRVSIRRPTGVAAGLEVRGGVSEVDVDGEAYKGHGQISLQTPGAASTADRYEIEVSGGASKISISTY
jgi:DNA-binding MarR family transcriptional regulator